MRKAEQVAVRHPVQDVGHGAVEAAARAVSVVPHGLDQVVFALASRLRDLALPGGGAPRRRFSPYGVHGFVVGATCVQPSGHRETFVEEPLAFPQ